MTFDSAVSSIKSHVNSGKPLVPFIRFTISNKLVIDTRDPKNQYFLSMTNEKTGTGMANKYTITIAYSPLEVSSVNHSVTLRDVNKIDKALSSAGIGAKITLQYGYTNPDVKSPMYEGMLIDFKVELRDQIILYTITGISSIASMTDYVLSIPEFKSSESLSYYKIQDGRTVSGNPLVSSLASGGYELYNKLPTASPINTTGIKNQIHAIKAVVKLLKNSRIVDYDVTYTADAINSINQVESIPAVENTTLFEYIDKLLSEATAKDDDPNNSLSPKSIFTYEIKDSNTGDGKTIRISRYKSSDVNSSYSLLFDWGSNKSIVKSFTNQLSGSTMMALYANSATGDSSLKATADYVISKDGSVLRITNNMGKSIVKASSGDNSVSTQNAFNNDQWSKAIASSYKASMSLIGIPAEINLTTKMYISALINGMEHHTSGVYMLTGVSDTLDANGMTTSFELLRLGYNLSESKSEDNDNPSSEDGKITLSTPKQSGGKSELMIRQRDNEIR